jgi:hypothetical protein
VHAARAAIQTPSAEVLSHALKPHSRPLAEQLSPWLRPPRLSTWGAPELWMETKHPGCASAVIELFALLD